MITDTVLELVPFDSLVSRDRQKFALRWIHEVLCLDYHQTDTIYLIILGNMDLAQCEQPEPLLFRLTPVANSQISFVAYTLVFDWTADWSRNASLGTKFQ